MKEDTQNKIENPETNPCIYSEARTEEAKIYSLEKTVSLKNWVRKTGQIDAKEQNWTIILYHIQKQTQNGLKT